MYFFAKKTIYNVIKKQNAEVPANSGKRKCMQSASGIGVADPTKMTRKLKIEGSRRRDGRVKMDDPA